jgi:CRP-like cAMP-binding protein
MPEFSFPPAPGAPKPVFELVEHGVENLILLRTASEERQLLFPQLEFVRFKLNQIVYDVDETIKSVYFPNRALFSLLSVQADGRSVEVGLVGKEGFLGIPIIFGLKSYLFRLIAQSDGTAYRMGAAALEILMPECRQLQRALQRYSYERSFEATQLAACNCIHEAGERLARWLLMSQDRLGIPNLPFTQELLSEMLGTRRVTVNHCMAKLQNSGAITSSRGQIRILDRRKLQQASCECYAVIQKQHRVWDAQRESLGSTGT